MLMTRRQYRDFLEAKFADFIRPIISKEIAEKTRAMIGSATPLRWDHPEWGLAMRLFRWDRAKAKANFPRKPMVRAVNKGVNGAKKTSI